MPTWGFFFYSLWYNSGQYFFWYANLSDAWLCVFNFIQAILEALGLTGILLFALYFPRSRAEGWRRAAARSLPVIFVGLFAVRIWAFGNYYWAIPTQTAYYLWYALTIAALVAIFVLLGHSYRVQVEYRPQIKMVLLGATVGLACWTFADTYETIGVPDWPDLENCVDFIYGLSFFLPLSIFYAIRRFRAMDVRFAIRRGMVFAIVGLVVAVMFAVLHPVAEKFLALEFRELEQKWWLPMGMALSLAVVFIEARSHRFSHHFIDRLLFPKWHETAGHLRQVARELVHGDLVRHEDDVAAAILDLSVEKLGLKCGAIYKRVGRDDFQFEKDFNLDVDCLKCGQTVTSRLAPLAATDVIFKKLLARHESPQRQRRFFSRRRKSRIDWSEVCETSDGATHAKGFPVPLDWSRLHGTLAHTTPSYAIPIVRRHEGQQTVSRVVVFGPHVKDHDLDPDEIAALEELCISASAAYIDLERGQPAKPPSEKQRKSSRKSSRKRR
jgi:hypothetical protein